MPTARSPIKRAANYNGIDTFTYRATDGVAVSAPATVTITLQAVNDPPSATADSYTTAEDTPLVTTLTNGVLKNDSDPDGDPLSAILVTLPSSGTLTLNSDGTFTYSSNKDFNGHDSFTYRVTDGTLLSDPVTVSITITPVNDPPVAVDDSYTVTPGMSVPATSGVLANDSDVDGDKLGVRLISGPTHGTLSLKSDGSFTYTPGPDFVSDDSFTYRANDGKVESATATVHLVGLLRMTSDDSTVTTMASQEVEGAFDVVLHVAPGASLSTPGYQVVLHAPLNSGIHFLGADATTQSPLFAGQSPSSMVAPDGTLYVSDLVQAGSAPISEGAHLFRVRYEVDPGVRGDITPVFDSRFTELSDPNGDPLPLVSLHAGTIHVIDGVAPTVTGLFMRSSAWNSAFSTYLAGAGLGTSGYALPVTPTAPSVLPWTNLDQVVVQFSEDVQVAATSLMLTGVRSPSYAIASMTYDPKTFTAVWTLAAPLRADKLQINLDGSGASAIKDLQGNIMDGQATASAADFHQRVNVVPGDATRSGVTNATDVAVTRSLQFSQPGDATYSPYADVDGSGIIDVLDVVKVRNSYSGIMPLNAKSRQRHLYPNPASYSRVDIWIAKPIAGRRRPPGTDLDGQSASDVVDETDCNHPLESGCDLGCGPRAASAPSIRLVSSTLDKRVADAVFALWPAD